MNIGLPEIVLIILVLTLVFGGKKITLTNIYPSNSTDIGFEDLKGKYVIDLKVE